MSTAKFKDLVHYIVHKCDPSMLGAIRLNKALWYVDVLTYQMTGSSVTGDTYRKRQFGPVPSRILATLEALEGEGRIAIQRPEYAYDMTKYFSLQAPDDEALSKEERHLVDGVLDGLLGFSANAISERTHDSIWRAAMNGEEIPLHATLVAVPGEVTPEILAWADRVMAKCAR